MSRWYYLIYLVLSLSLTTSSFSVHDYLQQRLQDNNYNQAQLQQALTLRVVEAQRIAITRVAEYSSHWLTLARNLARSDGHYALQLSRYYQSIGQTREQDYYFDLALKQGSKQAIIVQAEQLAGRGQYQKALAKLRLVAFVDKTASPEGHKQAQQISVLMLEWAVAAGDFSTIASLLEKRHAIIPASLIAELIRFKVIGADHAVLLKPDAGQQYTHLAQSTQTIDTLTDAITATQQCRYPIQFFADSLTKLRTLKQMMAQLEPFYQQQFCLLEPQYTAPQWLNCTNNATLRIQCQFDEALLQALPQAIRYIGVMTDKGIANVNHGMVFVDAGDSSQVLAHELNHFLGFIDEYPLPINHAACDEKGAIAHNVVNITPRVFASDQDARAFLTDQLPWYSLIQASTPVTHLVNGQHHLGTPAKFNNQIGLFPSRTCQYHSASSFKPIYGLSSLEYFEKPLPESYMQVFEQASDKKLMPSFHVNMGRYLMSQGQSSKAKTWFDAAHD